MLQLLELSLYSCQLMFSFLYTSFLEEVVKQSAPDDCLFRNWLLSFVTVRWVNEIYVALLIITGLISFLLETDIFALRDFHFGAENIYNFMFVTLLEIIYFPILYLHVLNMIVIISVDILFIARVLNHVIVTILVK